MTSSSHHKPPSSTPLVGPAGAGSKAVLPIAQSFAAARLAAAMRGATGRWQDACRWPRRNPKAVAAGFNLLAVAFGFGSRPRGQGPLGTPRPHRWVAPFA